MRFSEVRAKVGVKCCDECLTSLCRETSIKFASLRGF